MFSRTVRLKWGIVCSFSMIVEATLYVICSVLFFVDYVTLCKYSM